MGPIKTFLSVLAAILVAAWVIATAVSIRDQHNAAERTESYRIMKQVEEREKTARIDRAEACNLHLKDIGRDNIYAKELDEEQYQDCMRRYK